MRIPALMIVKSSFKYRVVVIIFVFALLRNIKRLRKASGVVPGKYLLLIAHPDDESMFFAPTLLRMSMSKEKFTVLCMSDGGVGGNGSNRREELKKVTECLEIRLIMPHVFEDGEDWSREEMCIYLSAMYLMRPFDVLITFDKQGGSHHKNHKSCFEGAMLFLKSYQNVKGLFLCSKNVFYKYVFDFSYSNPFYVTPFSMYAIPMKMMLQHRSQMLWFRYLYILFSNFMTYNDFCEF